MTNIVAVDCAKYIHGCLKKVGTDLWEEFWRVGIVSGTGTPCECLVLVRGVPPLFLKMHTPFCLLSYEMGFDPGEQLGEDFGGQL